MITLILSIASFIIVGTFIISVIYFPKVLTVVIPIVFFMLFELTTLYPNYEGYAVDAKFIPLGSEASVLAVTEAKDWIYLTVQFFNETEPRLVKIVNTPSNKKEADAAQQKAQNGLSVIRFDKNMDSQASTKGNKSDNNSASETGQGNSGGSYGVDTKEESGVSIHTVNVNESNTFQKPRS